MRNATFALTLLALLVALTTISALAGDFRNAEWGMSKEELKASESLELVTEVTEWLLYQTTRFKEQVEISYGFVDNKLVSVTYDTSERHNDSGRHMEYCSATTASLTEKYGTPTVDETVDVLEIRGGPHSSSTEAYSTPR